MNKKWEYYNHDDDVIKEMSDKYNISELLATVLYNKGITDEKELNLFLDPTRNDFHDPYKMPDMEKAVARIMEAMEKNEKAIVYGDYDVDGITSITVLKRFFKEQGWEIDSYIPNRLDEGYGLNKNAIKQIADDGYSLIITVDCGISGNEEVDYAYELGMEVIITDHHEPLEELPNALAVIDCKRKDSTYPFNSLAGVGVSFKLIQAIGIRKKLEEKEYLKYLDIVCIGTISDIVPLVDENRVIAKLGLKLLEVTKKPSIRALLNAAKYKDVNSNTISFGIAPRINACGRMGAQKDALDLFMTDNIVDANNITEKLNQYNKTRQEIEKKIFEEALKEIEKKNLDENNIIVVGKEGWHHGVIGIVASKITEMFFKPCILVCFEGEDGKGSGRSIPGFDLHEALCDSSEYLEKYGGHEMAIGLSLKKNNFEKFKNKIENRAKEKHIDEIIPVIKIDRIISIKDVKIDNVKSLGLLEPYGEANKMPVFEYKNLRIDSIRSLSEGKHLKLTLKDANTIINAIGFGMGEYVSEYQLGDRIDVIGTLEINSFSNVESVQINMKDLRKSY